MMVARERTVCRRYCRELQGQEQAAKGWKALCPFGHWPVASIAYRLPIFFSVLFSYVEESLLDSPYLL